LKLSYHSSFQTMDLVAPCAGAWIETFPTEEKL